MTPAQFASHVRLHTRSSTSTFTDADMKVYMRARQDEIAEAIIEANEDILLIPQYDDLVADQRDYAMPSDILTRLKRVEAKLDGTNFIKLTEIDINEISSSVATESDITDVFNNLRYSVDNPQGARFDIIRKLLYIYSGTITAVTNGIRVYCDTYPAEITNLASTTDMSVDPSTTTHGVPRNMHRIWAKGVIIDWKESRSKPIPLTEREQAYEVDLAKAVKTLKHGNLDREVIGELPTSDDRSYEGFNL